MLQPPRDEVEAETPALAADDKVPGIPAMSGRIKELKCGLIPIILDTLPNEGSVSAIKSLVDRNRI